MEKEAPLPDHAKLGHTLASPKFDHVDEVKLEQLGYKCVLCLCGPSVRGVTDRSGPPRPYLVQAGIEARHGLDRFHRPLHGYHSAAAQCRCVGAEERGLDESVPPEDPHGPGGGLGSRFLMRPTPALGQPARVLVRPVA